MRPDGAPTLAPGEVRMRKLRLQPDDLAVETFLPAAAASSAKGTVHGGQVLTDPVPVEPDEPVDGTAVADTCAGSCTCGSTCYIHKCPTYHTGSAAPCC